MSSSPGLVARTVLVLAVGVTAVSLLSLVLILGAYFTQAGPQPGLYWVALWGFPAGFVLMCLYVMVDLGRRRRLRAEAL